MEHDMLLKHNSLLKKLSLLPRKIVQLHGTPNIPEFVLHDLCHSNCFNLDKAAYFVDNPDFNWLKGVAGFAKAESFGDGESIWENQDGFSTHMKNSLFNQKVRDVSLQSVKRGSAKEHEIVELIADKLGLDNYAFSTWDLKHHNHGMLVYEKPKCDLPAQEDMVSGLYLLGFCPIH